MTNTFVKLSRILQSMATAAAETYSEGDMFHVRCTVNSILRSDYDLDLWELTREEATALGFHRNDKHPDLVCSNYLYLIPVWVFPFLPSSGELFLYPDQDTPKAIKFNESKPLSSDNRGCLLAYGLLAYGILLFQPPLYPTTNLFDYNLFKNVTFVDPADSDVPHVSGYVYPLNYMANSLLGLKATFFPGLKDECAFAAIRAWIPMSDFNNLPAAAITKH